MKLSGMTCRRCLLLAALMVCASAHAQERRVLRERATLKRHTKGIVALAISPDGKTLASAGKDRTIRLWDLTKGEHTATIFAGDVTSLAFSPDGKTLALVRNKVVGSEVVLWEVATGKELATLKGLSSRVTLVAYSPDGKRLAVADDNSSLQLWDVKSGKVLLAWKGNSGGVHRVVFSPDGKSLATAGSDGKVHLWDVATGKDLAALGDHRGWKWAVAFSPDGKTLAASGGKDYAVVLWDLATLKERKTLPVRQEGVRLAFNPDGKTLVTVGLYGGELRLWEVSSGKELARYDTYEAFEVVVRSPDGKTIATACADSTIKLWDLPPAGKAVVVGVGKIEGKDPPLAPKDVARVKEAVTDLAGALVIGKLGTLRVSEKVQVVLDPGETSRISVTSVAEFVTAERASLAQTDKVNLEIEVHQGVPGLAVAKVKMAHLSFVVIYGITVGECRLLSIVLPHDPQRGRMGGQS